MALNMIIFFSYRSSSFRFDPGAGFFGCQTADDWRVRQGGSLRLSVAGQYDNELRAFARGAVYDYVPAVLLNYPV